MRAKKGLLIVVALAILLAAVLPLWLRWRNNQSEIRILADAPNGSFVLQVEKPLFSLRAPWELPRAIFGDRDPDLRLTHASPGAQFGAA